MNNVFSYCMRQFVKRSVIRVPGRKISFFPRYGIICNKCFSPEMLCSEFCDAFQIRWTKDAGDDFFFIILRANIISWNDHRQAKSCIS